MKFSKFSKESNERLAKWVDERPESKAKQLAEKVAGMMDTGMDDVEIRKFFNEECEKLKMVLWVKIATVDMVAGFRAKNALRRISD